MKIQLTKLVSIYSEAFFQELISLSFSFVFGESIVWSILVNGSFFFVNESISSESNANSYVKQVSVFEYEKSVLMSSPVKKFFFWLASESYNQVSIKFYNKSHTMNELESPCLVFWRIKMRSSSIPLLHNLICYS